MIKCLGIDPGLAETGIGIVFGQEFDIEGYSFGSINTPKDMPLPARLNHIYDKILSLTESEKPDLIVVEDVFSLNKYPKSGITLGKVTGVILLAAAKTGVPVLEIPVREAKKILTGNGNANKQQLESAVRHLLQHPEQIKPDHASDAIALAIIGQIRYEKAK
ncbi:MAG: crossover junction endodeoxyribonuclease RuvC [Deltaproteobacteria bacterium]|nr:crossover junction endodeoxyribonuclease RuvC [Deltaproteobacteria bacterium]